MQDITNIFSKDFFVKNIEDTKILAEKFAAFVVEKAQNTGMGTFVCLFGDIGAGKTAFSRFAASSIGVEEKITSPSFVILNEYHSGKIPVYHFDLYRLENVGIKSIIDELEQYSEGKMFTLVEWAEFSQNQIPFNRIEINIKYVSDSERTFTFKAFGKENEDLIRKL
ncbi:tRNA (adenosine(37)-N6)-threonylcarbamoyltransferase complex ATPase subunit type 1 TsaE [bacterium]|nr:tRNA (adenosine(37)-N6)-threonylcarbamoyltransferase complex ATPase subunit type 1 TsaE [bacterium]